MEKPKTRAGVTKSFGFAAVLTGVVMLAGCGGNAPGQPGSSYRGLDLPSILKDVSRNPDRRSAAAASCAAQFDRKNSSFPFEYLVIGLLDVPDEDAEIAFCQALVEGAISGEITESDIAKFQQPRSQRGLEPMGDLLRKLLAAHVRLTSKQA